MKEWWRKRWTYKGRRLANPIRILVRFIILPILFLLRVTMFVAIWIGWDIETAKDNWDLTA